MSEKNGGKAHRAFPPAVLPSETRPLSLKRSVFLRMLLITFAAVLAFYLLGISINQIGIRNVRNDMRSALQTHVDYAADQLNREEEQLKFLLLETLSDRQLLRFAITYGILSDWERLSYSRTLAAQEYHIKRSSSLLDSVLKQNGVDKLARTVTVLCQRHLGLPQIIEEDQSLPVDDLLAYVLEKGNFGHKLPTVDASIDFYTNTGSVMFFNHLQAGGMSHWKAAQKYKVLRLFAWIYQSFRIVGVLVKNKKTPAAILKQAQHGADQRHLIEALGLKMDRMIEI